MTACVTDTYQHSYDAAVYRVRLIRTRLVITHRFWDDGRRRETMVASMSLSPDHLAFSAAISTLPHEAQVAAEAWWQANRKCRGKSTPTAASHPAAAPRARRRGCRPADPPGPGRMTITEQRDALDRFLGLVRMSAQGALEPGLDASLRAALGAAQRALCGDEHGHDELEDDGHPIVIASDRPKDQTEGLHETDLLSLSSVA